MNVFKFKDFFLVYSLLTSHRLQYRSGGPGYTIGAPPPAADENNPVNHYIKRKPQLINPNLDT